MLAYHFFAYGVVSKLEVDKHLVNNLLDVAAVTHRVQQVDGSLSNAHVTLRLTAQIYILLWVLCCCCCYYTHPFNGPLSGTTQVSWYQKGTINPDFTEARDSGWQWHQLGHMQVCTSLQTDNHASTPPLSFLQAGCPSCLPTNSTASKHYYYDDMPSSNWHRWGAYHFTVPGAISCYECVVQ